MLGFLVGLAAVALSVGDTQAQKTFRYIGCYQVSVISSSEVYQESLADNSPSACPELCSHKGYSFAGLSGQKCYCSNQVPKSGWTEGVCKGVCAGDSRQVCGDVGSFSYYGQIQVGSAARPVTVQQGVYHSRYVGCHDSGALLTEITFERRTLTRDGCRSVCEEQQFLYYGMQRGSRCFCGNEILTQRVTEDQCRAACGGDQTQICGGLSTQSLYRSDIPDTKPAPLSADVEQPAQEAPETNTGEKPNEETAAPKIDDSTAQNEFEIVNPEPLPTPPSPTIVDPEPIEPALTEPLVPNLIPATQPTDPFLITTVQPTDPAAPYLIPTVQPTDPAAPYLIPTVQPTNQAYMIDVQQPIKPHKPHHPPHKKGCKHHKHKGSSGSKEKYHSSSSGSDEKRHNRSKESKRRHSDSEKKSEMPPIVYQQPRLQPQDYLVKPWPQPLVSYSKPGPLPQDNLVKPWPKPLVSYPKPGPQPQDNLVKPWPQPLNSYPKPATLPQDFLLKPGPQPQQLFFNAVPQPDNSFIKPKDRPVLVRQPTIVDIRPSKGKKGKKRDSSESSSKEKRKAPQKKSFRKY